MGKWMTIAKTKRMFASLANKRLDTMEEINANTTPGMLAGASALKEVNSNLGGLNFYEDESGNKYVVGADSVPKKLGEGEYVTLAFNEQFIVNAKDSSNSITFEKPIVAFSWINTTRSGKSISYLYDDVSNTARTSLASDAITGFAVSSDRKTVNINNSTVSTTYTGYYFAFAKV